MARKRGSSEARARTTWPSSQRFLRLTAVKLILTWNAIRVFSGTTVTGPHVRTMLAKRRYKAMASDDFPARCSLNA